MVIILLDADVTQCYKNNPKTQKRFIRNSLTLTKVIFISFFCNLNINKNLDILALDVRCDKSKSSNYSHHMALKLMLD